MIHFQASIRPRRRFLIPPPVKLKDVKIVVRGQRLDHRYRIIDYLCSRNCRFFVVFAWMWHQ